VMLGDLTDPEPVLATNLIDFTRPVALLMVAVLHFIPDDTGPHEAVAQFVSALAPGSFLVLSHGAERSTTPTEVDRLYETSANPGVRRTPDEIRSFFGGLEFVEPGLVWTPEWRPDYPDEEIKDPESSLVMAGVARKP